MNATDLDPNFLLPLWRALVAYFRHYPPVIQAEPLLGTADRRQVGP